MSQLAAANNAALVEGAGVLPVQLDVPLDISEQGGKHQYLTADPATGFVQVADDALPGQIAVGYVAPDELTSTDPNAAGNARARVSQRFAVHYAPSTIANDGFGPQDLGVPFWLADAATPGKLSHTSTKNRTLGGIVLGLLKGLTTGGAIVHLPGVVGQLLAKAYLVATNESAGAIAYAIDASATTDQGTATDPIIIPRKPLHGHITSIAIVPNATLAAALTNTATLTIYKIDSTTGVVGAAVGTFTTGTQSLTKRQPMLFTLSATSTDLDMLETDVLGFARTHASSGAVIPQSMIQANMKVG